MKYHLIKSMSSVKIFLSLSLSLACFCVQKVRHATTAHLVLLVATVVVVDRVTGGRDVRVTLRKSMRNTMTSDW